MVRGLLRGCEGVVNPSFRLTRVATPLISGCAGPTIGERHLDKSCHEDGTFLLLLYIFLSVCFLLGCWGQDVSFELSSLFSGSLCLKRKSFRFM